MPELDLPSQHPLAPELLQLIASAPLPALGAGSSGASTAKEVQQWLAREPGADPLVAAGLWLLAGELDKSHDISQAIESGEGACWHAIMHRREGDFGNAKYWYRRVGRHSVYAQLAEIIDARRSELESNGLALEELCEPLGLPEKLVDRVAQALERQPAWVAPLQRITWWEWQLLFNYCHAR